MERKRTIRIVTRQMDANTWLERKSEEEMRANAKPDLNDDIAELLARNGIQLAATRKPHGLSKPKNSTS